MNNLIEHLNHSILTIDHYQLTLVKILLASLILCLGFLVYLLSRRFLGKAKTANKLSKKQAASLLRFVRFITLFGTVVFFFKGLGVNTSKVLSYELIGTETIVFNVYHLLVLYLIFAGTRLLIYLLEIIFTDRVNAKKIEKGKGQSLFQIVKYFVWVIAITIYLESIGFSITFMIASMSALLVGLGLGIQHFFNDIISGIVILFDRSVKVGDIVEIHGEMVGKIEEISLRTSKIISRDDVIVIVPNSMFTKEKVINWSHNAFKTRFSVSVGVAYGSNVNLVKQLLVDAATEHSQIESKPEPMVLFKDFGDSSLDFELQFYTEESFRVERIKSDLRFTINSKFIDGKVTIPFPQHDVHLFKKE